MTGKPVHIGRNTRAVLEGTDDISTWDDEELEMGQRRARNGTFTGKPPSVIPYAVAVERRRRRCTGAMDELEKRVMAAAQYVGAVAAGEEEPNRHRLHACEVLFNRVLGKEPQRIELDVGPPKPFQALMGKVYTDRSGLDTIPDPDGSTAAELQRLNEEALRKARSIETASTEAEEPSPAEDLEPQEERSGLLRRKKKVVHRPAPDAAQDQRAHIRAPR